MIQAKDYENRIELEKYIRAEIGDDMQKNKEANLSITGTRAELDKLKLSDETTIWGIKCVVTDTPRSMEENRGLKSAQLIAKAERENASRSL